ncbi:MAG: ABC transporter ATP-binding protein [Desulfocapsa sp.]|nr:MAG: ABC transporter ATP-binding protein [Desulfocapsa sp.]
MAPPLLTLQNIHLTFGGTPLLTGASFIVHEHDRLCLVGRNGSGKSTLLKIAAGMIEPDDGERFFQPGTTIRYLAQEPDFSGFDSTLDYVTSGLAPGDDDHRPLRLLEQFGLTGSENPQNLSGGEMRRVALAHVLAPQPDILLLDEPTNHLDLPAIEWLENQISSLRCAIVLISHDRRFLENLSKRTVWIDRGITRHLDRGFKYFESWRDDLLEQEEIEAHKLDRKIVREEHWLRYGVTARRKRNVKRLSDLHKLRSKRIEVGAAQTRVKSTVQMAGNEAAASGKLVIEAKHISKAFGELIIADDFSTKILRSDRVGIIGANGAGKTTLLNMLTGNLEPDSGTIRLGTNLEMVTLDQRRESLDGDTTLKDALTGGGSDMIPVADGRKHVIGYMKDFLFAPEQARTPIRELSGGERGRVMLARALSQTSNLLILDEPTNDLDLETLDLLQELLASYSGTIILISHDRDFLDRSVTSVIHAEGNGKWIEYAGGFSDMALQQKEVSPQAETKGKTGQKPQPMPQQSDAGKQRQTKMSFKDKHALETLPAMMKKLEHAIETFKQALADPDLFNKNPDRYHSTVKNLSRAEQEFATREERWLKLEMLKEELENNGTKT